ncbi:TIGR02450 family Trp-rich protein [Maribrevibacterium harenarium]|nr:TIGR02450 family Trp-rich protein [Maribrevibacterium harenarium]
MANQINPNKLYLSKWTSTSPQQKEKHFLVTKLLRNEQEQVESVVIEALMTKKEYTIPWQHLKVSDHWLPGWK